jgi:hypothetical protein
VYREDNIDQLCRSFITCADLHFDCPDPEHLFPSDRLREILAPWCDADVHYETDAAHKADFTHSVAGHGITARSEHLVISRDGAAPGRGEPGDYCSFVEDEHCDVGGSSTDRILVPDICVAHSLFVTKPDSQLRQSRQALGGWHRPQWSWRLWLRLAINTLHRSMDRSLMSIDTPSQ